MTERHVPKAEELRRKLGDRWPEALADLLDQQAAAAGELDALSQRQQELVAADDAERLLGVLGERRGVIERLSRLIDQMEPFNAVWDGIVEATPASERAGIVRRVEAIAALIDGVNARDAEDQRAMNRRRDEIAERLAGVRTGKTALAAYGPRGATGPRFQDREA